METLASFLDHHRTNEGEAESHTSYGGGKYFIPINENEHFIELYLKAISDGNIPTLNESILPGCKFVFYMDLDFPDVAFIETLRHHNYIQSEHEFHRTLRAVVERVVATFTENNVRLVYLSKVDAPHKIHIYAPTLLCNTRQFALEVLAKVKDEFFRTFNISENVELARYRWEKIFDAAPYTTGLRMPGSSKGNDRNDRYVILELDDDDTAMNGMLRPLTAANMRDTTIRLEVAADDSAGVRHGFAAVQEMEEEIPIAAIYSYVGYLKRTQFFGPIDKFPLYIYNIVTGFLPGTFIVNLKDRHCPFVNRCHARSTRFMYLIIDKKGCRIKCYDDECKMQNVDAAPLTPEMEQIFSSYTSTSLRMTEYEIDYFKKLGMKLHIPPEARKMMGSYNMSDFRLALLFFEIFKHTFRVDRQNKKEVQWYIFRDHRFVRADDDTQLAIAFIMTTYLRLFIHEQYPDQYSVHTEPEIIAPVEVPEENDSDDDDSNENNGNAEEAGGNEADAAAALKKRIEGKKLAIENTKKIIRKLEGSSVSSILSKAASLFINLDPNIAAKFDSHGHLLGFTNGVLDFKDDANPIFRPGRLDDYITLSTKYDYQHLSLDHPQVAELFNFFETVWPSEAKRTFALTALSKCLTAVQIERIYGLTGSGSNAKSKIVKLLGTSFLFSVQEIWQREKV
jgi:hypothetical protein